MKRQKITNETTNKLQKTQKLTTKKKKKQNKAKCGKKNKMFIRLLFIWLHLLLNVGFISSSARC